MGIYTKRLAIEPFRLAFLEDYCREFTEGITQYQYPDSFTDLAAARQVMAGFIEDMERGEMLELAVLDREGQFIGSVEVFGLKEEAPEIGLWMKGAAQGLGYGYEALQGVLDYLNSLGRYTYYRYEADVRNLPSLRLAEKFRFEKGGQEEVITGSGKRLLLQAYRIYG